MVVFFTKFFQAFVACGLGVSHIGFVCTAFGVADAICSLVFGPLIKLFGRMPLFVFGAVNNMLMIVTLMVREIYTLRADYSKSRKKKTKNLQ